MPGKSSSTLLPPLHFSKKCAGGYRYNQLAIDPMRQMHTPFGALGNNPVSMVDPYTASGNNNLDLFTYNYQSPTNNNMLDNVMDGVNNVNFTTDIKPGQAAGNYQYDPIGNLIADAQEQISNINWSVYGKIKSITRASGSMKSDMEFRHDSQGNRICKIVKPRPNGTPSTQDQWNYTFYMRDHGL